MAKLSVGIGSTGRTEYIYLTDYTSSSGAGKTGISYNTSGLLGHYVRNVGSATTITFASQTATGTWVSGGWAEVDQNRMPGLYRIDLPDAVFASGSDKAIVLIRGVSNTSPVALEYQLTALNLNTFTESSIASSTWSNSQRTITGGIADTVTTLTTRSGFATTGGIITTNNDKNGYTISAGIVTSISNSVDITTTSMSGIAQTIWSNAQRTITGGIADTVTTLTTRSGFAVTGGIITTITNPVEISTNSMLGIANTVWTNVTRTLSSTGISAYDVWNYANRTLTAASGATAYEIWNYNNRTLSATGLSAYDVWTYTDRIITGGTGVSITQSFPENFEFMLITSSGRIYLNKADIQKIKT